MARKTPSTSSPKQRKASVIPTIPPAQKALVRSIEAAAPKTAAPAATQAAVATSGTTSLPASVPHALIAQRAYELFCARGRVHGHEISDWLQAERELREGAARS